MKLTTEQLQKIEEKLYADYDFYYDDAKHEVIDHIASEIEEATKANSFENAFNKVFELWQPRLQETEWSGMQFYGKIKMPMFYKKRLHRSFKTDLFYYAVAVLFFPLFIYLFKDAMDVETIKNVAFAYKIVVFALAMFLNKYTLEKYENGEYTTVYGQIAAFANKKTIVALSLMGVSTIFMNRNIFRHKETIELWLGVLVFFNAFYFLFIIKYCNYFRHLKMIKNIKKWKTA